MHYDNDPSEPVQAGPAVTAAANDLRTASVGELTRPDLAEVSSRAAASTTAAHVDVDLRPAPTQQDNNTDTADPRARKVTGEQITTAHRLAVAAETLGQVDQSDRT